jgi:ABC-type branched-subunit amino acid transport system substrate-binding protein
VKAAFNYLNDHGGLGAEHARVVVKVCNTNLTPQGEVQCAQQAAGDPNAIAIIGSINVLAGAQVAAVLEKAGLANVNPAVADSSEATSPISFPLAAENLAPTGCALMMPSAIKATKVGFAYTSTPATLTEVNTAIASAGKAGVTSVGTVSFPITSSDMSPFVQQLAQKNPQAVTLVGSPQDVGQWLTAEATLGKGVPTCTTDALVANQALTGLGSAASDFYVAGFYPDPNSTAYPLLAQFRQQAAAEVAAGDASASLAPSNNSSEVLAGWLGAQAVIQAAGNVTGTVTKATLLDALGHTTLNFGTGSEAVLPPIDFATPNPNPSYSRLFNTQMSLKKWDPATSNFVPVPGATASGAQVAS